MIFLHKVLSEGVTSSDFQQNRADALLRINIQGEGEGREEELQSSRQEVMKTWTRS